MSTNNPTSKVYLGLLSKPYRFVLEDRLSDTLSLYQRHTPTTLTDFLVKLIKVLCEGRPDLMQRLAELDDKRFMGTRQQRRYFADKSELVYIGAPHLAERHTVPVDGYWLATNLSSTDASRVAKMVCEAAGLASASINKLKL